MIRKNILTKIRHSKRCKARLQVALDKSAPTIQRYLDANDIMLTTINALGVISSEFNIKEADIIDDKQTQLQDFE